MDNGEDSDSESVIDDAENETESIVNGGVEGIDSILDGCEDEEDKDNDGSSSLNNEIVAPMRSNNRQTVFIWEFPYSVSQSTYRGRNKSNACSIIALLTALKIHRKRCDHALLPFFLVIGWLCYVGVSSRGTKYMISHVLVYPSVISQLLKPLW